MTDGVLTPSPVFVGQDHRAGSSVGPLVLDFHDVPFMCRGAGRAAAAGEMGHHLFDRPTLGDVRGPIFFQTADVKKRPTGRWSWGAVPGIVTLGGVVPVLDAHKTGTGPTFIDASGWEADDRFDPEPFFSPDGRTIPLGAPVILLDSGKEGEQKLLAFPAGGGPQIVHWRNEEPGSLSTVWYDIDEDAAIDSALRFARTDTLFRICGFGEKEPGSVDVTAVKNQTLALNLTMGPIVPPKSTDPGEDSPTGEAAGGGGLLYMYGKQAGDGGFGIGLSSAEGFGPFSVGYGEFDKHFLYKNDEGLPVVPLAFITETAWHPPGGPGIKKKGPLLFEDGETPSRKEFPVRTAVHLTYDATAPGMLEKSGAWVWWTSSPHIPAEPGGPPSGPPGGPGSPAVAPYGPGGGQASQSSTTGLAGPNGTAAPPGPGQGPQTAAHAFTARQGISTHLDQCVPSSYGKPTCGHVNDFRYDPSPEAGDQGNAEMAAAPVTWRRQTFGARLQPKNFTAKESGPRAFWKGGTGAGGEMFADPIVQLSMVEDRPLPEKYAADLSTTSFWLCHADLWLANRYLSKTGTPADGWKQVLAANGDLCFLPFDGAGAADPQRTLKIQGSVTVAGLHNIFNFHRVTAGDTITIPSRQQMGIHGLLTVEAGGVLAISPDGQLAVRP